MWIDTTGAKWRKTRQLLHFQGKNGIPKATLYCSDVGGRVIKTDNVHQSAYEGVYCSL